MKTAKEILDTGAFIIGLYPQIEAEEFYKRLKYFHPSVEMVGDIYQEVKYGCQKDIEEYRKGGYRAVKKGLEVGTLPYAPLYDRIKVLGQIVEMGKSGYREERPTGKGDVVVIEVKNLAASLEAVKVLNTLLEQFDKEEGEEGLEFEVAVYPQFDRV